MASGLGIRISWDWVKGVPRLQHVLMLLLTTPTILLSILLAGCTAEIIKDFHVLSFSYNPGSTATPSDAAIINANASSSIITLAGSGITLQIRVGYFGYCVISNTTTSCSTDAATLATLIRDTGASDPLNLLYVAKQFRDSTIFSGLIFIGLIFGVVCQILLATYSRCYTEEDDSDGSEGSEREVKPFPSRHVSNAALLSAAVASLMTLIAALWQHLSSAAASAMADALTYGAASGEVGAAAITLGWVSTAVLILVLVTLLFVILSIRFLVSSDNSD